VSLVCRVLVRFVSNVTRSVLFFKQKTAYEIVM